MKKIPLHTIRLFYLSLVPVVGFLLICVFYGDIYEIFGTIIWICGPALIFLLPVILFLQVAAIINYIDAYKQVNKHCEDNTDNDE